MAYHGYNISIICTDKLLQKQLYQYQGYIQNIKAGIGKKLKMFMLNMTLVLLIYSVIHKFPSNIIFLVRFIVYLWI